MATFSQRISTEIGSKLTGLTHNTLQVNVGNRCNHLCNHCHIQATPWSNDVMSWKIMEEVLKVAEEIHPELVDITGGAPELNSSLPLFLQALVERDYDVQVRTNLTILLHPALKRYMKMYRNLQIRLAASLPCYLE
ncbi:MAG: radical SAM protein, partial [Candidatus Thorarchaeota archaeon]